LHVQQRAFLHTEEHQLQQHTPLHVFSAPPPLSCSPRDLSALLPGWVVRYWPILTRLCVTLGMLAIIRAGYFIPVPGVDMARLPAAVGGMEGECSCCHSPAGLVAPGLVDAGTPLPSYNLTPPISKEIILASCDPPCCCSCYKCCGWLWVHAPHSEQRRPRLVENLQLQTSRHSPTACAAV
jgi:hypothetical protein